VGWAATLLLVTSCSTLPPAFPVIAHPDWVITTEDIRCASDADCVVVDAPDCQDCSNKLGLRAVVHRVQEGEVVARIERRCAALAAPVAWNPDDGYTVEIEPSPSDDPTCGDVDARCLSGQCRLVAAAAAGCACAGWVRVPGRWFGSATTCHGSDRCDEPVFTIGR
jgi:hypothetical protein